MDTGAGKFITGKDENELKRKCNEFITGTRKDLSTGVSKGAIFVVGHTVWLKGSKFKIEAIDEDGMRLKLLPK